MNTLPLFPVFSSVSDINSAISSGVAYGFRFAGTVYHGIKQISAVRELTPEVMKADGIDAENYVEVKFSLLGLDSWIPMHRELVVPIR